MIFSKKARAAKSRPFITPNGTRYNLYTDILKQPHLLVAGCTGSGKSVVINGLIYTALFNPPGRAAGGVQLILIDPKRVELSMYRYLPHTIVYAADPPERLRALQCALSIVEARYKQMQVDCIRKYQGGHVYVIIDEYADLVTTQKRETFPLVQRLAQIGRAANVHVILATQTPIAKILPTEIKCNFDSRVGLRTRSAQDSRNIIGRAGLETLPRYGYGVYLTPTRDDVVKIPWIQETALQTQVDHWISQM